MGLPALVGAAIGKSDLDLRATLYSHVLLAGGSTLFKGLPDRLLAELKRQAPRELRVRIFAPPERKYSTWIGGSILASLSTFRKMWCTKAEYEEEGARAVHRKSFS